MSVPGCACSGAPPCPNGLLKGTVVALVSAGSRMQPLTPAASMQASRQGNPQAQPAARRTHTRAHTHARTHALYALTAVFS